jgi:hypothetical protein
VVCLANDVLSTLKDIDDARAPDDDLYDIYDFGLIFD